MANLWELSKQLSVQTGSEITDGFDIGFDSKIPEETKDALMRFVYWVEDYYHMPITLWVDFKFNHYLLDSRKKRVGYRFYHVEYASLSTFDAFDDIPVIELAVRTESRTMDEILFSFIEAVSCYFAWLTGLDPERYVPEEALTEEILQLYKNTQ